MCQKYFVRNRICGRAIAAHSRPAGPMPGRKAGAGDRDDPVLQRFSHQIEAFRTAAKDTHARYGARRTAADRETRAT